LLLLHVVNVHSLWIYELLPNNQCGVDLQRRDFEAVVWPWISAIVNVYLPIVVSATMSILLAVRPRRTSFDLSVTTSALDHFDVDDVQLSRVCVAIGLIYVLATSPGIALNLFEYFLPGWPTSFRARSQFYTVAYVCRVVVSMYEAIGYLLTLLGVSPIRTLAVNMLCCRRETTVDTQPARGHRSSAIEMRQRENCIIEETAL